jgi:hypothetical protein
MMQEEESLLTDGVWGGVRVALLDQLGWRCCWWWVALGGIIAGPVIATRMARCLNVLFDGLGVLMVECQGHQQDIGHE